MKQFGRVFNEVTEECFSKCIYSLADTELKDAEVFYISVWIRIHFTILTHYCEYLTAELEYLDTHVIWVSIMYGVAVFNYDEVLKS